MALQTARGKNRSDERHRKIAAARGSKWLKNVEKGKIEARNYPSTLAMARLKEELFQDSLASMLGVSVSHFGAIERGRARLSKTDAGKLAKRLKQPIEKLFRASGKKFVAIIPRLRLL